jgi:CRP/FNR family transcriptional regulator, cyclic AMP receptor protein
VDWNLLKGVPEEDRRRFLSIAQRRRFKKHEVVFHAGDPGDSLHLVAAGRFAVRAGTHMGDSTMLAVLGPGAFFGELALVDEGRRQASVSALETAETLAVFRDDFSELRNQNPSVDRVLVSVLAEEVQSTSKLLLEALYFPADTRVMRRLVEVAEIWGGRSPGSILPLTQEDLADLAGTTRPTANRVLRRLEEEGLVRLGRGRIEIIDSAKLSSKARLNS